MKGIVEAINLQSGLVGVIIGSAGTYIVQYLMFKTNVTEEKKRISIHKSLSSLNGKYRKIIRFRCKKGRMFRDIFSYHIIW